MERNQKWDYSEACYYGCVLEKSIPGLIERRVQIWRFQIPVHNVWPRMRKTSGSTSESFLVVGCGSQSNWVTNDKGREHRVPTLNIGADRCHGRTNNVFPLSATNGHRQLRGP